MGLLHDACLAEASKLQPDFGPMDCLV